MTVLLVLLTFAAFALIDYLLHRGESIAVVPARERAPIPERAAPDVIEGFHAPGTVHFHAGHGWALNERRNLFRVGMDEFASFLAGAIDKVELPQPGTWVRQGQKTLTLHRSGEKTAMVSPVEGEVVEVNAEVLRDPSLVRKDPYGRGWLFSVHVPDPEGTARNFIPSSLIRPWLKDAAERLYGLQPQWAGAVAADGGRPVEDPLAAMPGVSWAQTTAEFFLTGASSPGSEIATWKPGEV